MNPVRRIQRDRAFTLIELLIVIAILAIMTASSIAVITVPMREQVISGMEASNEAGVSAFFSKLIPDAHGALELQPTSQPQGVTLIGAAPGGGDVTYFIDGNKRLRRTTRSPGDAPAAPAEGAALLDDATSLTADAQPDTGLWRITVNAGVERLGRDMRLQRSVDVGVGAKSFAGGVR